MVEKMKIHCGKRMDLNIYTSFVEVSAGDVKGRATPVISSGLHKRF